MTSIRASDARSPTSTARKPHGPRNAGQGPTQAQGPWPQIRVRALEWTDLETLASLEQDLFADDAWSIETWWAELAGRPRRDYVVAVKGPLDAPGADASVGVAALSDEPGAIVGYGGLDLAGDVADIMTIATAPACRGRGIGRLLLDTLIGRAAGHGVEAIMLEVRADNAGARNLYERNGFDVISVRRRYYQPGDVDALIMRRLMKESHD